MFGGCVSHAFEVDIGVDLVAKHKDGTWIAIQCKCYEPSRRISGDDLNFIAGSQHPVYGLRWIVTTCRCEPTRRTSTVTSHHSA